jgi:hypothetical protein
MNTEGRIRAERRLAAILAAAIAGYPGCFRIRLNPSRCAPAVVALAV